MKSFASSQTKSIGLALTSKIFALVVSKWLLLGIVSPSFAIVENNILSAALPWWVGITFLNPVKSLIVDSNKVKLSLPA